MEKILIFDSDFLYSNKYNMRELLSKFEHLDCYITEVSLNELAYKNYSDKMSEINNFRSNIKNYSKLGIEFNYSDEEIKNEILDSTKSFTKQCFNNKIIMHHDKSMNSIVDRAYNKIAPFGKSDKGFKDTLILLDIIDFIKGKNVKTAYFITNDKDFIDNVSSINDEVKDKTKCNFEILDGKDTTKLLNYFKIGKSDKETDDSKPSKKIIDTTEIRNNLNDLMFNIKHYKYSDDELPFLDRLGNNFEIVNSITKEDISCFMEKLQNNIDKNIFKTYVKISDFFDNPFLFDKEKTINIDYFEKLNIIFNEIKDNELYKDAFIDAIYEELKEMIIKLDKTIEGGDIPY